MHLNIPARRVVQFSADNEYDALVNYLAQPNELGDFDKFIVSCRKLNMMR